MPKLSAEFVFSVAALLCASVSAVYDVRSRRIPNFITFPPWRLACSCTCFWEGGGSWPRRLPGAWSAGLSFLSFIWLEGWVREM